MVEEVEVAMVVEIEEVVELMVVVVVEVVEELVVEAVGSLAKVWGHCWRLKMLVFGALRWLAA